MHTHSPAHKNGNIYIHTHTPPLENFSCFARDNPVTQTYTNIIFLSCLNPQNSTLSLARHEPRSLSHTVTIPGSTLPPSLTYGSGHRNNTIYPRGEEENLPCTSEGCNPCHSPAGENRASGVQGSQTVRERTQIFVDERWV